MAIKELSGQEPTFPINVRFNETRDVVFYENIEDLVTGLEWFDSEDASEDASVHDCQGRKVRVLIAKLELLEFCLIENA